MSKAKKFSDIIERIEHLRKLLNLNKSRFSADIGMKPQTYNNFIGAQGSKPNVELIFGIVNQYGANPMWLLNGSGPIFLDDSKSAEYLNRSPVYRADPAAFGAIHEARSAFGGQAVPIDEEALRSESRALEPLLRNAEGSLREIEQARLSLLDRSLGLLRRYHEAAPATTLSEIRTLLQRIEQRLAKPD